MDQKDFSGAEQLVLGSVYALRTWRVDAQGRLCAVAVSTPAGVWKPGENVATCQAAGSVGYPFGHATDGGSDDCKCGFWAYHLRAYDEHWTDARVSTNWSGRYEEGRTLLTGVVAVSGHVLVGTRGLRAEKATPVAICIPRSRDEHVAKTRERWHEDGEFWHTRTYAALLPIVMGLGAAVLAWLIFGRATGGPLIAAVAGLCAAAWGGTATGSIVRANKIAKNGPTHAAECAETGRHWEMRRRVLIPKCECFGVEGEFKTRAQLAALYWRAKNPEEYLRTRPASLAINEAWRVRDRIAELYPDVKIFDTVEEMDAAYAGSLGRLDGGSGGALLRPDDPKLWGEGSQVPAS